MKEPRREIGDPGSGSHAPHPQPRAGRYLVSNLGQYDVLTQHVTQKVNLSGGSCCPESFFTRISGGLDDILKNVPAPAELADARLDFKVQVEVAPQVARVGDALNLVNADEPRDG